LLSAFAERGIEFRPNTLVRGLDPTRNVALLADGGDVPYDLFLGVPRHHAPAVVQDAGLCVDGWIPVDPRTLETSHPGVFATGDVRSGSVKRVASAVGEGSMAVQFVHEFLKGK
jgi:sulfide:quinone oxidoreductase